MKQLLAATVVAAATGLTAFGQGSINFANSAGTAIFDNFTTPGTSVKSPANVDVAMMWTATTTATPIVGTTGSGAANTSTMSLTAILADPNFTLALNATGNSTLIATTRTGIGAGTFSGNTVDIAGTSAGETIKMYVIAWSSQYATPQAAAAANSAVGWSNPFTVGLGGGVGTPSSLNGAGMTGFDVNPGGIVVTPEPSTMALGGLGALAMMFIRRRK